MPATLKPIRVGIVCDLHEEGWHSMDLIGEMLLQALSPVTDGRIVPTCLRPAMVRRWTRLPAIGGTARARLGDRLTSRLWDYPRWLERRASDFDVFHIVDHSYAHLVHVLPAERTIVTCHDIDALRPAVTNGRNWAVPAKLLARHLLGGLKRAGHIACVSGATKAELLATGAVAPERVSVVHEGVHPSCTPMSGARAATDVRELLHVGSTIPRKRIDVLLEVFAAVRRGGDVRLLRVGGPLTPPQRALARKLGVLDAIVEMPYMERSALADLYRRASLVLLPSEREGFGLPVIEAMACGTPVVASDLPALREVGGEAVEYCRVGDVSQWAGTVTALLAEESRNGTRWARRRTAAIERAAPFSWNHYARRSAAIYEELFRACGGQS